VTSGHMPFAGNDNVVSGDDPNKQPSAKIPGDPADQGAPLNINVVSKPKGYYFDVIGWVRTASSAAPSAPKPWPHPVGPPQFTGGTFEPAVASGFGADSIAEEFIDLAKDSAKNFVLDQLGLSTASDLADLKARIDAVDAHLTKIAEQLNAAIVGLNFDEAIRDANSKIESLKATFDQNIKPLIDDVIDVRKAEADGDKAAEATARARYEADKQAFVRLDGANTFGSRATALHLLFQPGSGATGLMTAFGDKLLTKQRYLTFADSQRQDAVYTKYEEYQALASWITCEWDIARDHLKICTDTVIPDFMSYTTDQRDPKLAGSLPPDVPAGVVLDRGPSDAQDISSLHKSLLTSPATSPASIRWAFWQETPIDAPDAVPSIVQAANAAKLRGFDDWQVASGNEIYSLLAGRQSGQSIVQYLAALGLTVADAPDQLWTRDSTVENVRLWSDRDHRYRVHESISLRDAGRRENPPELSRTGPYYWQSEIDFAVRAGALGQVLLARSTGDTRYF
jgi:hypothetical protein